VEPSEIDTTLNPIRAVLEANHVEPSIAVAVLTQT